MGIGKKIKWAFIGIIGLIICVLLLLRLYFAFSPVGPPDVFHGVQPDLGYGPQEEVISHVHSHVMLGNTEYEARIGTSRYNTNKGKNLDYYFCWISKRYMDEKFGETWYPFFSRWIPSKEVPSDLWGKDVNEIVSYDEDTRAVTFECGFTNYTCILPPD